MDTEKSFCCSVELLTKISSLPVFKQAIFSLFSHMFLFSFNVEKLFTLIFILLLNFISISTQGHCSASFHLMYVFFPAITATLLLMLLLFLIVALQWTPFFCTMESNKQCVLDNFMTFLLFLINFSTNWLWCFPSFVLR